MTTNGVLFNALFKGNENNIRKILYGAWLVRDWNFENTSLTDFSLFESDGNLISTLFAPQTDDNPYGGWHDLGYMDEKGPDFNQQLKTKPTKVMQSRWPARYDYTEASEEISAKLVESNPVVDAIRSNQTLSNLQSVGTIGYASSAPVDLDIVWRQCLFIGVDGRSGLNYYVGRVYPKVLFGDFGKSPWNIDDPDALPIKALAIPDEFSVSPDGIAGSPRWILRDGPAWRAQGGPTLWSDPQTAPVATAQTGDKFTLVLAEPTTPNTPFTYAVTANNTTATSTAVVDGVTVSTDADGQVTLSGGALITDDDYTFTVTATGANGTVSAVSSASNSITALA